MTRPPDILFLMTDQMQARVLEPAHPCHTPNLDGLAGRGVRFTRAYTPNPVCSPARASLMTGLLPHNHGVLWVTHNVAEDQGLLRTDKPHWAQHLARAGYRTGYFGKWHVERSNDPGAFGWQVDGSTEGARYRVLAGTTGSTKGEFRLAKHLDDPPGYEPRLLYAVTDTPPEARGMGRVASLAETFLEEALADDAPWCCFVSLQEPHDPFIAGAEAFERYDPDALELPPFDDLNDKPGLYRKAARAFAGLSERERREAAACYYASITELDAQFGRLLKRLEDAGRLDTTLFVLTSDHGELLGAHGLYCKNVGAFEEVYRIPLIVAGPGVAAGVTTDARVGLHELAPTLLELAGAEPLPEADGRAFTEVLRDPAWQGAAYTQGYAEYHGTRYLLSQRVLWEGDLKFVFNGFDEDELYDLARDPFEQRNLANDSGHQADVRRMMQGVWRMLERTGDRTLLKSHYPPLRLASRGPLPAGSPVRRA